MPTAYPDDFDSFTPIDGEANNQSAEVGSRKHDDYHNDADDAIVAIQQELGKNPRGIYATVKAWLQALADGTGIAAAAITNPHLAGSIDPAKISGTAVVQARQITSGTGLTGGGDLSADRSLAVDFAASGASSATKAVRADDSRLSDDRDPNAHAASHESGGADEIEIAPGQVTGTAVVQARQVATDGTTLTGGGDLSANRTLSIKAGGVGPTELATGVIPHTGPSVLNGDYSQWTRGTSWTPSVSTGTRIADRWTVYSGTVAETISRVSGGTATDDTTFQYACRLQRDSGDSGTGIINLVHALTTADSLRYAGKQVTVSVYLRKGADLSGNPTIGFTTGTGTDQTASGVASGEWTGASNALASKTPTTDLVRYSHTATLSASLSQLAVRLYWTPSGTAGAADYLDVVGWQIDEGSAALPFRHTPERLTRDLCDWFVEKTAAYGGGGSGAVALASGFCDTSTSAVFTLSYSPKRVTPTVTASAGDDFQVRHLSGGATATTAITASLIQPSCCRITATVASGLTAGSGAQLTNNNDAVNGGFLLEADL